MFRQLLFLLLSLFVLITIVYSQTALEFYDQAEDLFKDGNYKEALYYYKKSLEKNPYYSKALFKIGRCYTMLDDPASAKKYYEKVLKTDPNHVGAMNSLGYLALDRNKLSDALKFFKKALKLSPLDYESLIGAADVYTLYKDYYTAGRYLDQAIKKDNKNPLAYIGKAKIKILEEKYKEASSILDKARRQAPGSYQVYFYQAIIAEKNDQLDEARSLYEKAYSLDQNDTSLILNLADVYLKSKYWDKAINPLQKAINLFPEVYLLQAKLGFAYQMDDKPEAAITHLKKARDRNITDDIVNYHYENLLIKSSSFYNPRRVQAADNHFRRAYQLMRKNQNYDSLSQYRRGLQIFSQDWKKRYELAGLYKKMGFLEKYLQELQIAIKLNPDRVELKDKLEIAEQFREKRLSYKLGIEQYNIHKDNIKILLLNFAPLERKYIHLSAGKIIADSLNNHLRNYNRFDVYEITDNQYYLPSTRNVIRKVAEKNDAEYYAFGHFEENADYLSLNMKLYSVNNDEPLASFKSVARGKDKLYYLSKNMAQKINEFFPVYGTIIDIKDDLLVLNIGRAEDIKKKDKIEIYEPSQLKKDFRFHTFYKSSPSIKSTAIIIDVDEQISVARLEKKWDINKVSIQDTIKLVTPDKKKK
ncbi:MAG: tetratricopeptide repeat protein [Spirochaetes bacterium]|nr:tetratricopeptide repeat protein [Spirochaetota bacterium]